MLSIAIRPTILISNTIIIAVDNHARGVETVCLNASQCFIQVSWSCHADALCRLQHNVFKFLEVGIMAEGGDDSTRDIHHPSNWEFTPQARERRERNVVSIHTTTVWMLHFFITSTTTKTPGAELPDSRRGFGLRWVAQPVRTAHRAAPGAQPGPLSLVIVRERKSRV